MKLNTLKTYLPLALLAFTQSTMAHPGPPGHKHDGAEDWPFPDFSWPMVIIGLALAALAFGIYYYQKHQSE